MTALTGRTIAASYKDVIQVSNVGNGIDATARPVESGAGQTTPLQLSATVVNINSGWQLGGTSITVSAATLNALSGTNTGDQTITLTSEASGSGTGSFAVTLANAAVIGKVLTGFAAGAGVVAATDTILAAFNKIVGNIAALVTGVSSVFGRVGAVVATTGDYTSAQITEVTNLFFTNARAIAATLTAYAAGAGTVSATDSILAAIQKLDGNDGLAAKKASNLSDLASAVTARVNLGLNKTGISFHFPSTSAANGTYVLASSARVAGTIASIKNLKTGSGTITGAIQINGTNVTSLSALAVTNTPQSVNSTGANTFAIGDRITLVLTSNATATDLEGELEITI